MTDFSGPGLNLEPNLVLGIDPGFTGALAILDFSSNIQGLIDMPLVSRPVSLLSRLKSGQKVKPEIDPIRLYNWLKPYQPKLGLIVIELVGSRPDQGVSSTFRFGEGLGILRGVVGAIRAQAQAEGCGQIGLLTPPPAVWKAKMNVNRDKETSLEAARNLIGTQLARKYLNRKMDHGRAEALLLAKFGLNSLFSRVRSGSNTSGPSKLTTKSRGGDDFDSIL